MQVAKDMAVIVEYTVRLEDGSFVKGENGPVSLNFIVDYNEILPSLERRLLGLKEGEQASFVIPAQEAFGEYDSFQVRTRSFDDFPEGRSLAVGKWVVATNPETQAQYSYYVKEKKEETIILDFNHPLAGKDLYYDVKIIRIRPASIEEIKDLRPCEGAERQEDPDISPSACS
ncbi:MAG: peptidylprolyl isomerase [Desulforhabdus sp.]|jgi:FKBP-type peptidyl-prolyl cis-trans isomerase SlyD|nr:peptidylprolyl isomerase [Desulforhabdus sp.]